MTSMIRGHLSRTSCLLALAIPLAVACDPSPLDPLEDDESFRGGVGTWPPPGGTLNTAWLGDSPLMRLVLGQPFFELTPDDVRVSEIDLLVDGHRLTVPPSAAHIDHGLITVTVAGVEYTGDDLVGSRWWLSLEHEDHLEISEVDTAVAPEHWGYRFDYVPDAHKSTYAEVCRASPNEGRWAYVVGDIDVDTTGTIHPSTDTLLIACASGALGKAITWGFTPWSDPDPTAALDLPLYQTGVRTVMADYCGVGQSHTEDGTAIQVKNAEAGQDFDQVFRSTEAVFGPQGALCLLEPRIPLSDRLTYDECTIPACGSDQDVEALMAGNPAYAWTKLGPGSRSAP